MAKVDTMPIYLRPLMRGCSVKLNWCAVCGSTYPLNQHHVVKRSAGKMYDCHGVELPKPTITLCGSGNTSGCHGKAHAHKLHFRWVDTDVKDRSQGFGFATIRGGHWEVLETPEPMREFEASQVEDGWRPLRGQEDREGCFERVSDSGGTAGTSCSNRIKRRATWNTSAPSDIIRTQATLRK